jgi:hypothetical protein
MPPRFDDGQDRGRLMSDGEWEHFWSQHDAWHEVKHDANLNQQPPDSDEPLSAPSSDGEQTVMEEEERGHHQPQATPPKVTQTNTAAIARKAQRANRCGSCAACICSDCGCCKNCKDKPRRATAWMRGYDTVERTTGRM